MAYFLKKTTLKGRTYLSIVESFYSHEKRGAAHRTYKSLASVETWKAKGIEDPIAHFQKEVDELNSQRKNEGVPKISTVSPELYLGYFPFVSLMNKMNIKKYVDYFNLSNSFEFDLYELLSSLIYARLVNPCSKHKTFHEVLPQLKDTAHFSYDQLLDGLAFMGNDYGKFIEIFNEQMKKVYNINTSKTYFDCTNFYFEIDREDDFRRKGPSKENRKDPIVSLGLLLDANQIPIGMKLFPGNESEKPILRDVIQGLKKKNQIAGKTIHVADKGLNCTQNIAFSKENGDGYLFSKSVKTLPEKEKKWVLLDNEDWKEIKNDEGALLYKYKSCIDKFPYRIEIDGKKKTIYFTEKRVVTYNPKLASKKRYEINKQVEKAKKLCYSQAKRSEYGDLGKYVNFTDENGEKAKATINEDIIKKELELAGYNLLITSETDMKSIDIYNTYHNLWRIEESFRIMKSNLDARPVFLQKENSIKGHFLICYLTVLLERIFQFKVLDNKYSTQEIIKFVKSFKAVKGESKYINVTASSKFIKEFEQMTKLPLTNYYLTERQIKQIFNYKV